MVLATIPAELAFAFWIFIKGVKTETQKTRFKREVVVN